MAETGVRHGRALRVYQLLAVLAAGWLAGRLPALLAENRAEEHALAQSLGVAVGEGPGEGAPAAGTVAVDGATADLAARVAAQVAAQVADETIRRLIAAGWAPTAGQALQPGAAGATGETVVRVVTQTVPAPVAGWTLPLAPAPGPAVPGLAAPGLAAPGPASPAAGPAATAPERTAHAVATAGYAALKVGDRRQAAALLEEAARMAPNADGAAQWKADAQQLSKRWTVAGYVLSRSGSGGGDALAASPVLGGGQAGAAVGYLFNPYAPVRVSAFGRVSAAAAANGGLDSETTEAALGLRVQPWRKVPLAFDVERRFALGAFSRDAWAARVSGGSAGETRLAGRRLKMDGYGEAGVIGFTGDPALYGGAQMWAGTPVVQLGQVAIDGGAGMWGAAQRDYGTTVSRFDLGPSARFQVQPWPFKAQVDYRVRAAGNAAPGSGPVITLSGEF